MSTSEVFRHCHGCGLAPAVCVCARLPRIELPFRLLVVQHRSEPHRQSNTVRILRTIVPSTVVLPFGKELEPFQRASLPPAESSVVLFPRGSRVLQAHDLIPAHDLPAPETVPTLVLLDGSWGQARRMARRVPGIHTLPFVRLPEGKPSSWTLRRPHQRHMLCTFEAASRAIEVAGEMDAAARLMRALRLVELRGLYMRGLISARQMELQSPAVL